MNEHKLAVGYCRVSTGKQAKDGVSLAEQERKIRLWCEANGFTLVKMYIEARSGKNVKDRPRFETCVRFAGQLKAAMVVYDLTRSARSLRDALDLVDRLKQDGAGFVSLSEGVIDTTTPQGELVFAIFAAMAEFERKVTAQKTKESLMNKRRNGKKYCGTPPYGYKWVDKDMVEEPSEQATLRLFRTLILTRKLTWYQLFKVAQKRRLRRRNGKPWDEGGIKNIYKKIVAGKDKRPGATKAPIVKRLPVLLKKDIPLPVHVPRKQGPPKPRAPYESTGPYGAIEEYKDHIDRVWHPLLRFEEGEEPPEGFRNPTENEEERSMKPTPSAVKKFGAPGALVVSQRSVDEMIEEEGFEDLDEKTRAVVAHLLSQSMPTQKQLETALDDVDDVEVDDTLAEDEDDEQAAALPWQVNQ